MPWEGKGSVCVRPREDRLCCPNPRPRGPGSPAASLCPLLFLSTIPAELSPPSHWDPPASGASSSYLATPNQKPPGF